MALSEEWKKMCDLVVEKLRSDLAEDPDNVNRKREAQAWIKGIQDTLCPTPAGPAITVESIKGWHQDMYLPQGLEGETPQHTEDIKTELRLL